MARPTRQRQTPTKAEQRRSDLIARLIDLFLTNGFADASVEDLAHALGCSKSTLYSIAGSKEQMIVTTVRHFFGNAAARIETRLRRDAVADLERIRTYLMAIAEELAPASPAFFADLDAIEATREIYQDNTQIAARRLQEIVLDAVPAVAREHAVFVGAVAAQVMEGIHRGEIETATGLDDSAAYRALADLIVAGLANPGETGTEQNPAVVTAPATDDSTHASPTTRRRGAESRGRQ